MEMDSQSLIDNEFDRVLFIKSVVQLAVSNPGSSSKD